MRISDRSSDVCSSDLFTDQDEDEATGSATATDTDENPLDKVVQLASSSGGVSLLAGDTLGTRTAQMALNCPAGSAAEAMAKAALKLSVNVRDLKTLTITPEFPASRSEEHTSELQSLMRISYAVFCLKKQTRNKYTHTILYS